MELHALLFLQMGNYWPPLDIHLMVISAYGIFLSKKLITRLKAFSPYNPISALSFLADDRFIVTAGIKRLKLWTITYSTRSHLKTKVVSLAMHGKPINLNGTKEGTFVSVAGSVWTPGSFTSSKQEPSPIYALTDSGMLYFLQAGLLVGQTIDLMAKKGFGLSVSSKMVACACNGGIVKLFDVMNLTHSGTLCFPELSNSYNARIASFHKATDVMPPDALACQFMSAEKLVIYSDHGLYIWDIHDTTMATRCCAIVSHSTCITDIRLFLVIICMIHLVHA